MTYNPIEINQTFEKKNTIYKLIQPDWTRLGTTQFLSINQTDSQPDRPDYYPYSYPALSCGALPHPILNKRAKKRTKKKKLDS
jgi:hypothetical protein